VVSLFALNYSGGVNQFSFLSSNLSIRVSPYFNNYEDINMGALLSCELHCFESPHLNQIYDGFDKLHKSGIINLAIKQANGDRNIPLLTVIINNKYKVIYDTLDGLNWIDGSIEDNLNYFKNSVQCDFYFKRSYVKKLAEYTPINCRVHPLGLYYSFTPESIFSYSLKDVMKNKIGNSKILLPFFKNSVFRSNDFEYYPIPTEETKILFLTRLWDPNAILCERSKMENHVINTSRINCINACKKQFGERFLGGLQKSKFSQSRAKELIISNSITSRRSFVNLIKNHDICITTTGLHDSIGSKFGEYVAASRAIISEPIKFELPGEFEDKKNYYIYNDEHELIDRIESLIRSKEKLQKMMWNNFSYYNNYLRPDLLVLNTLSKICDDF
jgi:hypothetical protein